MSDEQTTRDPHDMTEKELLIDINRQLAAIRQRLGDAAGDRKPQYRCAFCDAQVAADERERHLKAEHDAPADVDVDAPFRRV